VKIIIYVSVSLHHYYVFVYYNSIRVVRLTSPCLNTLIVVGAIILYISTCILTFPTSTENASILACNVSDYLGNKLYLTLRMHLREGLLVSKQSE